MISQHLLAELIIECLLNKREYFQELIIPITLQKTVLYSKENVLFHEEINKQYVQRINNLIATDISKGTGAPYDLILEFLQELNYITYLED